MAERFEALVSPVTLKCRKIRTTTGTTNTRLEIFIPTDIVGVRKSNPRDGKEGQNTPICSFPVRFHATIIYKFEKKDTTMPINSPSKKCTQPIVTFDTSVSDCQLSSTRDSPTPGVGESLVP